MGHGQFPCIYMDRAGFMSCLVNRHARKWASSFMDWIKCGAGFHYKVKKKQTGGPETPPLENHCFKPRLNNNKNTLLLQHKTFNFLFY